MPGKACRRSQPSERLGLQFRRFVWCQTCTAETFNFDTLRTVFVQFVRNRTLAGHLDASFDLQTSEFRFADVRVSICRRPSFDLQTSEFRFADVRLRYTNSEFADASPCKSGIGGHRWGDRRIAPKVSPGCHFRGFCQTELSPNKIWKSTPKPSALEAAGKLPPLLLLGSCGEAPPLLGSCWGATPSQPQAADK